MELRKLYWRKPESERGVVNGTINRTRVIRITQVYRDRYGIQILLRFGYGVDVTIDTTDIKVAKKEAIRLLNVRLSAMNDDIKSLTI